MTGYRVFRNGSGRIHRGDRLSRHRTRAEHGVLVTPYLRRCREQSVRAVRGRILEHGLWSPTHLVPLGHHVPSHVNVPITFTAAATATGGTAQYKFMLYSSTMGWRVGQDYNPNNVFTWFPPMGQNALQVWVRTSGSTADYEDWSATGLFTVGVTPAQLTAFSSSVPFPTAPTTTITWTAAVSGSAADTSSGGWTWRRHVVGTCKTGAETARRAGHPA